ncbi:MAG: SpoIIE family protein phosphatase [Candidatus Aegiribacteria sp.]|nr:SpoIIE family protein phosphatase [Candidatus Aegiribacteria sp.]
MNSFRLAAVFEKRGFPGGIQDLLRRDAELLIPPRWADNTVLIDPDALVPDALLLIINGPLSTHMRNTYFNCYRRGIPIAGICYLTEPEDDPVALKLSDQNLCWSFSSAGFGRELLRNQVQDWLRGLNRESFPFPEGKELIQSYGDIDVSPVDQDSYESAREVLTKRGFVCLSGSLGAGKTTIARRLLIEAAREGLNPVEFITRDLYFAEVVQLLTGPEDCAVFLDIDTLRRIVDIYPLRLWSTILTLMIRVTETRHRLILATSSPEIAVVFDTYHDAHIKLPEPSTSRKWRLKQGQDALKWFRSQGSLKKAGLLLLAAFDPVVPEAVFKSTLFKFWDRLIVQEDRKFPSTEELELLYSNSLAAQGIAPFRRISGSGEVYIAVSDSMKMWAIDNGIQELLKKDAPIIRAFADTLIGSSESSVRRAGYFLAGFYGDLSDEVRAKLLLHIAAEESGTVLTDVLNTLLSSINSADESIIGMYRIMMEKGSSEVRGSVAGTLFRSWVMESAETVDLVNAAAEDPDPRVRGQFIQGLTFLEMSERGSRIYNKLLEDDSIEVRQNILLHIGSKFPDLSSREYEVLNDVLESGDSGLLPPLIIGLLDRELEEFNQEFSDLLWVLMERLPDGGRGRLAWRIGARLRFFSREVRKTLRSDLSEKDVLPVTRCMLMNYSSLDEDEKKNLWVMIHERVSDSRAFAHMVLRYYSIMDETDRNNLLKTVLVSERYDGREALSQLICRGRTDLAEASFELIEEILADGEFEKRALLPFFVLWNGNDLGENQEEIISAFLTDNSPLVRKSLVRAVRRLGVLTSDSIRVLVQLSADEKRAVRAAAGAALGEFESDGTHNLSSVLITLLSDEDPFVRLSTLSGLLENVLLSAEKLLPVVSAALDDPASEVRLEAVQGLRRYPAMCSKGDVAGKLAERLVDPDRNVRMEVVELVTETPELLASKEVRNRMPDILLNRLSTGHAIAEELSMARKIQLDLLPDKPPNPERYDIESYYRPAREVGGDYFDFFHLPDRNLGIAIADVAGKGIPAALTMAGLKGNLEAYVQNIYSISEIMQKVNESSVLGEGDLIMTGLFYSVLDLDSGKLTYVNAGHNPPLLVRREGSTTWLDRGGLILGLSDNAEYEHGTDELEPGDVLVLYTDGITEAMDKFNVELGIDRLKQVVLDNRDLSAQQIAGGILEAVNSHSDGIPQGDDQTLVVVKHR